MKQILTTSLVALALLAAPPFAAPAAAYEMARSSPNARNAPFDVQYLDTMAEHHREGIEMFRMAADRAQRRDIRQMAERMIGDQEQEIPELNDMREQIGANLPEAVNMKLPGMKPMDMGKLEAASGREFDRRFLDMTIMHHKGALTMSRSALKRARNEDVRKKAQEVIDKQAREIADMEVMRRNL